MSSVIEEGIRLREETGLSVPMIAARLGGSIGCWQWRFFSRGVERRGVADFRPEPKQFDEVIKALRLAGASHRKIAEMIGKSHTYVQYSLARIARRDAWDDGQS